MKIDNQMDELFEEFGSSISTNVIIQGPGKVLDLRKQLLKGCVQCGKRIGEFMLSQDIACALTAGHYEIKKEANELIKGIWADTVSLSNTHTTIDGLVRASGEAAEVLKTLKEVDRKKFLEVLSILWRYAKEKKGGKTHSL